MSEIIDNLIAAESAKAFAEGEAKTNTKILKLIKILSDNNRMDDIKKMAVDPDFFEQLKKEFHI